MKAVSSKIEYILNLSNFNIKKAGTNTIRTRFRIPENEQILLFWCADYFDIVAERGNHVKKRLVGSRTGWEIRMENSIVQTDMNLYYINSAHFPVILNVPTSSIQDIKISDNADMLIQLNNGVTQIPSSLFFPKGRIEKSEYEKKETISAIASTIFSLI